MRRSWMPVAQRSRAALLWQAALRVARVLSSLSLVLQLLVLPVSVSVLRGPVLARILASRAVPLRLRLLRAQLRSWPVAPPRSPEP